jgi:hypothetical protein
MNFLKSMLNYAKSAWGLVDTTVDDIPAAFRALWKFTGAVHILLSNLFGNIARALHWNHLGFSQSLLNALGDVLGAVQRIRAWIWAHEVHPLKVSTNRALNALARKTAHNLFLLREYDIRLFFASLRYAYMLVHRERAYRIRDIKAARAYSVQLVKASLATVNRESADGYNSGLKARKDLVSKIADDLANRVPAVKGLVKDLIKVLLDFLEVDNPVLRIALSLALSKVVSAEGVDKITGSLLTSLIGDLTGERRVTTLQEVTAAVSHRLGALEDWQEGFAANGGQQLENAGKEWSLLESLPVELSIIAFFAEAVANPQGWATAVNDTAGAAVNAAADAISAVIRK